PFHMHLQARDPRELHAGILVTSPALAPPAPRGMLLVADMHDADMLPQRLQVLQLRLAIPPLAEELHKRRLQPAVQFLRRRRGLLRRPTPSLHDARLSLSKLWPRRSRRSGSRRWIASHRGVGHAGFPPL